ncbi:MAG: nitroreductase family protein [Deltaproteobacteria bacterium]|nr:nitroreductase family protein [Deltaproteobacteria bacterium]
MNDAGSDDRINKVQYDVLMDILAARRSVREFQSEPVDSSDILKLTEAFDSAPQAGGQRGRKVIMLDDQKEIALFAETARRAYGKRLSGLESQAVREGMSEYGANFFWFKNAPLLAVSVIRRPPLFFQEFGGPAAELLWGGHLSAAMAIESLLLAAVSLGLGGCCLGGHLFAAAEIEAFLGLSQNSQISLMAALGRVKSDVI